MNTVHFNIPVEGAENFIKALIRELKPMGICREGGFSILETDLPLDEDEILEEDDGFTYHQFDFNGQTSYLEYESCTGSKISLYILAFGKVVGLFENIGRNTYYKFIRACGIFPETETPPVFIPARATRHKDRDKIINLLEDIPSERRGGDIAHQNGWHPRWVHVAKVNS